MSLLLLFRGNIGVHPVSFVEPILDQVKSILESNLSTKLDEIDSEWSDFELDDISDYFIGEMGLISQYPAIELIPVDSPGEEFTTVSVKCTHRVAVRIWATDDQNDRERLSRRIYRYQRAVTEVLKEDDNLNSYVDLVNFVGHEYESWQETEFGATLYGGKVVFDIDKEETLQ